MVSGPVLLKIKGTSRIFILWGLEKRTKICNEFDEIGQMLVPRALDDTKKIRKAGADIFGNCVELKNLKKLEQIKNKKMAEVSVSVPPSPGVTKVTPWNK